MRFDECRGWGDAALGDQDLEATTKMDRKYLMESSEIDWNNPFTQKP